MHTVRKIKIIYLKICLSLVTIIMYFVLIYLIIRMAKNCGIKYVLIILNSMKLHQVYSFLVAFRTTERWIVRSVRALT